MSFLDNVTSAVNRGTAAAGRSADRARLKSQLSDITKRRQNLAAQLGASLYEATKNDVQLRMGREGLYDAIAACDIERDECQRQIEEIDAQAAASATAAATFSCVVCGARMTGTDLFCSGCGTPAAQARPAYVPGAPIAPMGVPGGPACPSCGAPMNPGDLFCMSCGARIDGGHASVTVEETVEPAAADAGAPSTATEDSPANQG